MREDPTMQTAAVLITGPPGAGKTSVLERLATLLEIEGVSFGAIEVEQFCWGSPWLSGEPVLRQLAAALAIQRETGRHLFLVAATTETDQELHGLILATGAEKVTTVLLTASPELVAERIRKREPDDWPGKRALVEHARQLAVSMPMLAEIDLRLSTDDRTPTEIARELLNALRSSQALA